jgi:peptidylprolyl isomerase
MAQSQQEKAPAQPFKLDKVVPEHEIPMPSIPIRPMIRKRAGTRPVERWPRPDPPDAQWAPHHVERIKTLTRRAFMTGSSSTA